MDRQQGWKRTTVVIGAVLALSIATGCSSDDDDGASAEATTPTTEELTSTTAYDEAFAYCAATDFLEVADEYGVPGSAPTIAEAANAYSGDVSDVGLRNDTFRGCLAGFQSAEG